jgi:hypothetical protein
VASRLQESLMLSRPRRSMHAIQRRQDNDDVSRELPVKVFASDAKILTLKRGV